MRFQNQQCLSKLVDAVNASVLGYEAQVETVILCLVAGGHVSALGDPGTGKTLTMKALSKALGASTYRRVQMVPDMMPADILGTEVWNKDTNQFVFVPGPLDPTVNLFHADEINRTPPRTQAALLEAMEENQLSVSGCTTNTFPLNDVFMLLATQNPLENDGVYPLPEAQLDRFAVQLLYPKLARDQERLVLKKTAFNRHSLADAPQDAASVEDIKAMRLEIDTSVFCSDEAFNYAHDLTYATHPGECPAELTGVFKTGVSVRAAQWALRLARVRAYLHDRDFVMDDDIKFVAPSVLRHRLYISEEMAVKGWTAEKAIGVLLDRVPIASAD